MDAIEFLKEKDRMCKNYAQFQCDDCPLSKLSIDKGVFCKDYIEKYPEKAIEVVEKWSKENPKKTRQNEFLKMFPNACKYCGAINICPVDIDKTSYGSEHCNKTVCAECKKNYWLEEIE